MAFLPRSFDVPAKSEEYHWNCISSKNCQTSRIQEYRNLPKTIREVIPEIEAQALAAQQELELYG